MEARVVWVYGDIEGNGKELETTMLSYLKIPIPYPCLGYLLLKSEHTRHKVTYPKRGMLICHQEGVNHNIYLYIYILLPSQKIPEDSVRFLTSSEPTSPKTYKRVPSVIVRV